MVRVNNAERRETNDCVTAVAQVAAPPLAPGAQAIDLAQLSRMTLGEESLEREVLALFDLQAGMLLARMANEAPKVVAGLAHTLTGSARGIGAWTVAEASEAVERVACTSGSVTLNGAVDRLSSAVAEAQAAITTILSAR
jgi:hypothetical protein